MESSPNKKQKMSMDMDTDMSEGGGLVPLRFGDDLRLPRVERYKGVEDVTDVLNILSLNVAGAFVHWDDDIRYFYCFHGQCCEDCGPATVRRIIPVVQYSLTGEGTHGSPLLIKYLSAPKDLYDNLVLKQNILQRRFGPKADISQVDMYVTCSDGGYQKLAFEVGDKCYWRSQSEMVEQVKALYEEYKRLIESSVARRVSPERYFQLKDMAAAGGMVGGNPQQQMKRPQYGNQTAGNSGWGAGRYPQQGMVGGNRPQIGAPQGGGYPAQRVQKQAPVVIGGATKETMSNIKSPALIEAAPAGEIPGDLNVAGTAGASGDDWDGMFTGDKADQAAQANVPTSSATQASVANPLVVPGAALDEPLDIDANDDVPF